MCTDRKKKSWQIWNTTRKVSRGAGAARDTEKVSWSKSRGKFVLHPRSQMMKIS